MLAAAGRFSESYLSVEVVRGKGPPPPNKGAYLVTGTATEERDGVALPAPRSVKLFREAGSPVERGPSGTGGPGLSSGRVCSLVWNEEVGLGGAGPLSALWLCPPVSCPTPDTRRARECAGLARGLLKEPGEQAGRQPGFWSPLPPARRAPGRACVSLDLRFALNRTREVPSRVDTQVLRPTRENMPATVVGGG